MHQGGINAANGFFNNFNVTPLQVVAMTSGIKRDKREEPQPYVYKTKANDFANTLKEAMKEYSS